MKIIKQPQELNISDQNKELLKSTIISAVMTILWFITAVVLFGIKISLWAPVGAIFIVSILSFFVDENGLSQYAIVVIGLVLAAVIGLKYKYLYGGFRILANFIISTLNAKVDSGYLLFNTSSASQLSCVLLVTIISIAMLVLTQLGIKTKSALLLFVLYMPIVFSVFYLNSVSPNVLLVICVLVIALLLMLSLRAHIIVIASLVVVTLVCLAIISPSEYAKPKFVTNIKSTISDFVYEIRYMHGAEEVDYYKYPSGDFTNVPEPTFTDNTVITLKTQTLDQLYLKNYVGSIFNENCWQELPSSAFSGKYTGIMHWLQIRNFYPQSQISNLYSLNSNSKREKITIENKSLSSCPIYLTYEYYPYGDLEYKNINMLKDSMVISKGFYGTRKYTFETYNKGINDYSQINVSDILGDIDTSSKGYKDYMTCENAYKSFVYDTYLSVPDAAKQDIISIFGKDAVASMKNKSYKQITDYLRKYYSQYFSASLETPVSKAEGDFLTAFADSRTGYDIHFATLSTLVFRYAGIPARYVEGYYVDSDLAKDYTGTSDVTVEIKDSNAHAWTEIYISNLGWVPVEVTPNYYDITSEQAPPMQNADTTSEGGETLYPDTDKIDELNEEEFVESETGKPFNILVAILSLVGLVFLVYVFSMILFKYKEKRNCTSTDTNFAVISTYKYVTRRLKAAGLNIHSSLPLEFAGQVDEAYGNPMTYTFEQFVMNVYEARFGGKAVSKETATETYLYAKKLASQITARQGILKRVYMKLFLWI